MGVFRLRAALVRRATFVLAAPLLLAPALTGAPTATAAEPGPVITSPTAGQQVGGEIQVTVQSTAPYVLVAWGPEADAHGFDPVPTQDGVATVALSTSGYVGPTAIVARECATWCSSGDVSTSDAPQSSVLVDVSNPAPQWNERAWFSEIHGDVGLWGVKEDPWAWYGFFVDGKFQPPVFELPWVPVGPQTLSDGPHTVQMAHCSEMSRYVLEPVCDMVNATEPRTFVLKTKLHPTIDAVEHRTISPDGNGVADAATVTMTADSKQLVIWSLMQGSKSVAGGDLDAPTPGPYTFTVDGRDAQGQPLASGTYTLRVASMSTPACPAPNPAPGVDDRCIYGETSTPLKIDLDAPAVTNAAATPRVLRTRAGDHMTFTGELSEPASRFRVRLRRNGTVVRRLWLGPQQAGRFTATWDGRRPSGALMRGGTYRYEFLTRDRVGNRAIEPGGTFELRWRR